ncbi:MAG: helix-turn-helix domain-containing protein [Crocosphaera sp.]|nr:helix-turn-helix domain-containing protein [Crocosphaera sp.]
MPRSVQLKPELKKSIKTLLPRNGFPSQQALAEHLGISRDVVSRFLNSKPVDRLNAEEICGAIGCDIREVTYIEETQPKEIKIG